MAASQPRLGQSFVGFCVAVYRETGDRYARRTFAFSISVSVPAVCGAHRRQGNGTCWVINGYDRG